MLRHARWSQWTRPTGPEPCAVLACRGAGNCALAAIERANAKLPEFQRITRWVLWPEPDLPRTSTGKVRRKPVAAWLARIQAAAATPSSGKPATNGDHAFGPSADWLLALIAQIYGRSAPGVGDELRLTEDLASRQPGTRAAGIGDRGTAGNCFGHSLLEEVQTLGELRKVVASGGLEAWRSESRDRRAETGSCRARFVSPEPGRGRRGCGGGNQRDVAQGGPAAVAEVRPAGR